MEGNVCGMICGVIPAFVWRDRGSSQKIMVRIAVSDPRFELSQLPV